VTTTPAPAADLLPAAASGGLDDPGLTALGLLAETCGGLHAIIAPELESFGFSMSAFEVVLRLARSPGGRLRMAELTAQCTLTSSGLTRVVDRLERAGLVVRQPCPSDRRGSYAVVTAAGLEHLTQALPAHTATIRRCYTEVLEPDELDAFVATLRKIRAVVSPGSDPDQAVATT
jgi:DNA-binding MarR family transcriptional regulator